MADTPAKKKESKVEAVKRDSRRLRGSVEATLASGATHFEEADTQVLKVHGVYQQDDRDARRGRKAEGLEPAYSFMVRVALPGGRLTAEQYLELDAIAEAYGGGSLRITTRQGIQFHGILMHDLKDTVARINERLMTTFAACGDVERNVMTCPAPLQDKAHVLLRRLSEEIARELRPATRAYHEIWLDEERVASSQESEPFYGEQYLPRKFKTGIATAEDNCIDVYSYDCGLIAIVEGGAVKGFNVVVGGGMGMSHGNASTYAKLAEPLGFIDVAHAVETVRAIAAIFRDHGNRADRKHARLKYLIDEWGMERFAVEFRRRVPFVLEPFAAMPPPSGPDHLGRHDCDGDATFYGVHVANGRIIDRDGVQIKTALREIVERLRPGISLTPQQNLLFTRLQPAAVDVVEEILARHGVRLPRSLSGVRRYAMACPAMPTCGLAITESERMMPTLLDELESEFAALGLSDEPIAVRMTGCPNGCARPYTADLAFVGRKPGGKYNIYVGGGLSGDRVVDLFAEDVDAEGLVGALRPLLSGWAADRREGEGLGDYYQRLAQNAEPRRRVSGSETPTQASLSLKVLP